MMDMYACPRIDYGKGVCGTAWSEKKTQIVSDVSKIENYIACDLDTKSEIVIPMFENNDKTKNVIAVFDIDSTEIDYFKGEIVDLLNFAVEVIMK